MAQNSSWEANSSSANQEIPRILRNPKVHYHIHISPVPIPSYINPVHSSTPLSEFILILSYNLRLGPSSGLFPAGFPTKTLYAPLKDSKKGTYLQTVWNMTVCLARRLVFLRKVIRSQNGRCKYLP